MSDDESKFWGAEIAKETAELADEQLGYGDRSDLIQRLAEIIAHEGFDNRTPYDAAIQRYENDLESLRMERDQIESKIDEKQRAVDTLREKRSQYESVKERLDGRLDEFETKLRSGTRVWPGHSEVERIAGDYNLDPEVVVDRLRERNPDVPSHAFTKYHQYADDNRSKAWNGLPGHLVDRPPSERDDGGR